jgi:S-adenosylmethionine synthetase
MKSLVRTSESVTEGHPDKVADLISDSVLDAALAADPQSRVAVETLVKDNTVIVAGEITCPKELDYEAIVRQAVRSIGYTDPETGFNADSLTVHSLVSSQSPEIGRGVDSGGAGDQGIMFGYACTDTPERLPLSVVLAHRITRGLAEARRKSMVPWLLPDGKAQVSVEYLEGRPIRVKNLVVSTQHRAEPGVEEVRSWLREEFLPSVLGEWWLPTIKLALNPAGSFVHGGPAADCGVTGRKIIVDTYGGLARHGGGAFSGKDPTKVDRSAAYAARQLAKSIVASGAAHTAEVCLAYAIGQAQPVSVTVHFPAERYPIGTPVTARELLDKTDLTPDGIIRRLDLRQPIYAGTVNYGHFGRPDLPWERVLPCEQYETQRPTLSASRRGPSPDEAWLTSGDLHPNLFVRLARYAETENWCVMHGCTTCGSLRIRKQIAIYHKELLRAAEVVRPRELASLGVWEDVFRFIVEHADNPQRQLLTTHVKWLFEEVRQLELDAPSRRVGLESTHASESRH